MPEPYDELRAYVATEQARRESGLMQMILDRLDDDAATIAYLRTRLAVSEALVERHGSTIDWNLAQYERWKADERRLHAEAEARREKGREREREVAGRVIQAWRAGRKTVRVADMLGESA